MANKNHLQYPVCMDWVFVGAEGGGVVVAKTSHRVPMILFFSSYYWVDFCGVRESFSFGKLIRNVLLLLLLQNNIQNIMKNLQTAETKNSTTQLY